MYIFYYINTKNFDNFYAAEIGRFFLEIQSMKIAPDLKALCNKDHFIKE